MQTQTDPGPNPIHIDEPFSCIDRSKMSIATSLSDAGPCFRGWSAAGSERSNNNLTLILIHHRLPGI